MLASSHFFKRSSISLIFLVADYAPLRRGGISSGASCDHRSALALTIFGEAKKSTPYSIVSFSEIEFSQSF